MTIMRAGLWLPWATPREGAHAELRELVRPERFGGQVLVLRPRSRAARFASFFGVSSFAPVFARSRARFAPSAISGGPLRGLGDALVAADEDEPLERVIRLRVRLPATRVVGAENQAVDDRTRLLVPGERAVEQPGDRAADPLRGTCDGGRRGTHRVGVELVGRAEPDEDEPLGGLLRVEDGRPTGLRPNVLFFGDPGGAGDVAACGNAVGADRDREDVGFRKRICDFDSHSGRDAIRQGFYGGRRRFTQLSTSLNFLLISPIHTAGMTPLRPLRFRRSRSAKTVESLTDLLVRSTSSARRCVRPRRARSSSSATGSRSRRAQWELSHALIERYSPGRSRGSERGLADIRFGRLARRWTPASSSSPCRLVSTRPGRPE